MQCCSSSIHTGQYLEHTQIPNFMCGTLTVIAQSTKQITIYSYHVILNFYYSINSMFYFNSYFHNYFALVYNAHTITATSVRVEGVASIATACVRANSVVTVLGTLVCPFCTLINIQDSKADRYMSTLEMGQLVNIIIIYHHSDAYQHSVDNQCCSCKCKIQRCCGSSVNMRRYLVHTHRYLQENRIITQSNFALSVFNYNVYNIYCNCIQSLTSIITLL